MIDTHHLHKQANSITSESSHQQQQKSLTSSNGSNSSGNNNTNNNNTTTAVVTESTSETAAPIQPPSVVVVDKSNNDNIDQIEAKKLDERNEQRRIIKENWRNEPLYAGQTVNLISAHWLRLWKTYVRYDENSPRSMTPTINRNNNQESHASLKLSAEFDIPKPETINNRDLIEREDSEGGFIMAENRLEGEDFEIIPTRIWELLVSWYGGGPEIKRTVVEMGVRCEKLVEVRPIIIMIKSHNLVQPPSPSNGNYSTNSQQQQQTSTTTTTTTNNNSLNPPTTPTNTSQNNSKTKYDFIIQRSRKSGLNDIREFICKKELLDPMKLVIIRHTLKHKEKELKKNLCLEDLKFESVNYISYHFQSDQRSLFGKLKDKLKKKKNSKDLALPNGAGQHHHGNNNSSNVPNGVNKQSGASYDHTENGTSNGDSTKEIVMHRGACGLTNLGNTCFMNTSVQCLAHTTPFAEYFLSGRYTLDINKVNPLGMKGQIAEIFGKLMRDMWSGATCVIPKNLKWAISKYAPQFSGISQQDSQELLSFLLDGLHEDLNKVLKKPYIEDKEETKEQREDSIVASEQWENHLKRNQSIVVNLFQGQYKSTLTCSQCSKVSITFDPFMFVTLPIPVPTERLFEILLFRCKPVGQLGPDSTGVYCLNNAMAPIHYCLRLNKRDFVQTLRIELSKASGIETPCLALAEIFRNRIYTFLSDQKNLSFIKDRDVIIGYELPVAGDDVSRLHVMQRKRHELILLPYVLLVKFAEITCKEIYRMVWERVGHRVKRGWKTELMRYRASKESMASTPNSTTSASTTNTNGGVGGGGGGSGSGGVGSGKISSNVVENESPISSPEGSQFGGVEEDDTSSITDDESDECIYPFVLKTTNGYGNSCDRCHSNCNGCAIPCDNRVLKEIFRNPKYWSEGCSNVTIEWRPEILRYLDDNDDIRNSQLVKQDQSVALKSEMSNDINLNDCFSLFTRNEKLGPNDTWYCPQCKIHIEGHKKLEIWSAPRILIIHLKRFQFHHRHEKINAFVDFPLDNLDLSKWVLNKSGVPPIYQLYGVSNHMGGMGGGHYTAFVKNRDRWIHISDSSYHLVNESSVKTNEAYVLFYELKKPAITNIQPQQQQQPQ